MTPRRSTEPEVLGTSGSGRSFSWMLGGDLVNKSLRFAATVVLARTLSPADFGVVNVAIAVSGVIVIVATMGLADSGARLVAVDRPGAGPIASMVLGARLCAGAVLAATTALVAVAASVDPAIVVGALAMTMAMSASGDWLLRGTERTRSLGIIWTLGGGTLFVLALALTAIDDDPALALAAFASAEGVLAAATWAAGRDLARPVPRLAGSRALVREAWPLAVSALIVYSYYANIDTLVIAATRSTAEAGLYSAPYRVFLVINTVGVFAAYALAPGQARASVSGGEVGARLDPVLLRLCAFGAGVVGASMLVGAPTLGVVFGVGFEDMADTFVMLCVGASWYAVGYPLGYSMIADGRNSAFLKGAGAAGVVNVALLALLVPNYGAVGAGIATAAAFAAAAGTWGALAQLERRLAFRLLGAQSFSTAVAVAGLLADGGRQVAGLGALLLAAVLVAGTMWGRGTRAASV